MLSVLLPALVLGPMARPVAAGQVVIQQLVEANNFQKAVQLLNLGFAVQVRAPTSLASSECAHMWIASAQSCLQLTVSKLPDANAQEKTAIESPDLSCTRSKADVSLRGVDSVQSLQGWKLLEHVNVPSDSAQTRYTFESTMLHPGQVWLLCSTRADEYLAQQCNATASLGINGNDALVLLDSNSNVQVCCDSLLGTACAVAATHAFILV